MKSTNRINEGKGQTDNVVLVPLALVIEDGAGKEENGQDNRVELFSDEADGVVDMGDNVELFGEEDGACDMGDNVELF